VVKKANPNPPPFNAIFLIVISLIVQISFANPEFPLTENGALIWATTGLHIHGAFPVNGGNRIFTPFSAMDAYTSIRHIYLQVFDEDGTVVYENPIMLSLEDHRSGLGGTTIDQEGNIFIAWIDVDLENQNTRLYAQKYNSEGQPEWGEEPILVGEFGQIPGNSAPVVLPDEHGGFYFLTNERFPAIDENGDFRDGWQWLNTRPDNQLG